MRAVFAKEKKENRKRKTSKKKKCFQGKRD